MNQDYILNINLLARLHAILKHIQIPQKSAISSIMLIYTSIYAQIINILTSFLCDGKHNKLYIKNIDIFKNNQEANNLIALAKKYNLRKLRNNLTAHPYMIANGEITFLGNNALDELIEPLEKLIYTSLKLDSDKVTIYDDVFKVFEN